jgi:hypothetical protein
MRTEILLLVCVVGFGIDSELVYSEFILESVRGKVPTSESIQVMNSPVQNETISSAVHKFGVLQTWHIGEEIESMPSGVKRKSLLSVDNGVPIAEFAIHFDAIGWCLSEILNDVGCLSMFYVQFRRYDSNVCSEFGLRSFSAVASQLMGFPGHPSGTEGQNESNHYQRALSFVSVSKPSWFGWLLKIGGILSFAFGEICIAISFFARRWYWKVITLAVGIGLIFLFHILSNCYYMSGYS